MSDTEKVETTLLTGGLGTGKTTTLAKILENTPKDFNYSTAVNETGFDTDSSKIPGETFPIEGTCIGCGVEDLEATIEKNWDTIRDNEHFFIESTGQAGGIEAIENISGLERVDLTNAVRVVSAEKGVQNYRDLEASNIGVLTFEETNEDQVQELTNDNRIETSLERFSDINWELLNNNYSNWSKQNLPETPDMPGLNDSYLSFRGMETGHGRKYMLNVDNNTEPQKIYGKLSEIFGDSNVRIKGFDTEGKVFDLVNGEPDIKTTEGEPRYPGITLIEESDSITEEQLEQLESILPESNMYLDPGHRLEDAAEDYQELLTLAEDEKPELVYEQQNKIPVLQASDELIKLHGEITAYPGWDTEMLKNHTGEDLTTEAAKTYIENHYTAAEISESAEDYVNSALHSSEVLYGSEIGEYTDQKVEASTELLADSLTNFGQEEVEYLESLDDAEGYHEWFIECSSELPESERHRVAEHLSSTYRETGELGRANDWEKLVEEV